MEVQNIKLNRFIAPAPFPKFVTGLNDPAVQSANRQLQFYMQSQLVHTETIENITFPTNVHPGAFSFAENVQFTIRPTLRCRYILHIHSDGNGRRNEDDDYRMTVKK